MVARDKYTIIVGQRLSAAWLMLKEQMALHAQEKWQSLVTLRNLPMPDMICCWFV